MRKKYICVAVLFGVFLFFAGCSQISNKNDYLRIHIKAHSNVECDQEVKYEIKDLVVNYLTPYLTSCNSKEEVITVLENKKLQVETIINDYLKNSGFSYTGKMQVANEFFPTRYYGKLMLPSDYYDAIIINLGDATGDNWWCVVYPPLCFVDSQNVVYKSKIASIINKFFNKN